MCRIYDLVEAEGRHFLVMEYVDGEDLASLLRRIGRLPADKAVDLARGMCAGLAASHDKGVLHRDLKPANIMVDGRGQPRITDFGLASEAGGGGGEIAGTPAYMAPEQLAGEPATTRSDVYALGLVLYETFTGRRRFEAATVKELVERHRNATAPSLADVRDVPAAVERAIARSLDEDPAARPESARALLSSLPGGDPLQAAVEAGETPSPAMVAAAAEAGDLTAARAWACLGVVVAGLVLAPMAAVRFLLLRQVGLSRPPEVLSDRAGTIAARLGYAAPVGDRATGFEVDDVLLAHLAADVSPGRWEALRDVRPAALRFYDRRSPQPLAAWGADRRVGKRDPPLDLPGMTEVSVDPEGRLLEFAAVPPPAAAADGADPDWATAFAEAGLDVSAFSPIAPSRSAPVDSDVKAAWQGPEGLRVDAAARAGRVVWWRLSGPWERVEEAAASTATRAAQAVYFVFLVLIHAGGVLVARRNLRAGRGDRRGAFRLAAIVFLAHLAGGLLRADHVPDLLEEFDALVAITSRALWWAAFVGIVYVAAEPHVRRRWPHMLISWSRLLAGRWRDPMVGRDVLVGAAAGTSVVLVVMALVFFLPPWLGAPPATPRASIVSPLGDLRHMLFFVFASLPISVVQALSAPFLLLVLRYLLRRDWAALLGLGVFCAAFTFMRLVDFASAPVAAAVAVAFSALAVVIVKRGTLLALVALAYYLHVLEAAPLTLDLDAWYADRSFLALGLLAVVAAVAFHVSLGGKPALPPAS